ncbi:hypothetical protein KIN20_022550 [Parelaphostrongylus tenuis]|uniref:PHD-type domain-containing protein n=1 Tax=Parelaphostrongylus tenuis TaxID=148309 RepID=A0AAD5MQC9_PARTN|nr:hypothetical protein KIN20_022550 [Parelaphostrongylus tenuis]
MQSTKLPGAAIIPPSRNLLGDLSNIATEPISSVDEIKHVQSDERKKWKCRHNSKELYFSYEEAMQQENKTLVQLRERIERPVIQEICNRVHHSTYSLDDLVESIESCLKDFYVKDEHVEFSPSKDRTIIAKYDGKEIGRINGRDLKRRYLITENDIRSIVLLMGSQQPGKPWQIEEAFKKEYGIKDKLAPIFCSSAHMKSINKISSIAKRDVNEDRKYSDSDSDAPLSHFVGQRRSGVGSPPSASLKETDKEKRKQEKKLRKERLEKEKAQKENSTWGLNKFISRASNSNETSKTESSGSPFLAPQKRRERIFKSALNKLHHTWRKHDEQGFIVAAAWSAKVLPSVQIEKISNEYHRFAVRRAYNKLKDAEVLKRLRTAEARREFRKKMHEDRHEYEKIMRAKIKSYFNQEAIEEDLAICDEPLKCFGVVPSGQSPMFTDCLTSTQFFASFGKFLEADHKISASELLDAIHGGRAGFVKCTAKLFGSLLKALLKDPVCGKLTHFNIALREFSVEDNTVSELCRALLMGSVNPGEQDVHNAEGSTECSDEGDVNGNGEGDNDRDSECATPCDFNDVSKIDIDVCQSFLDRFPSNKELWELNSEDQLGILGLLINRVFELHSFKEYISQDGSSEAARSLRDKITKLNEQITSIQEELSSIPEIVEVDVSLISRAQTLKRVEMQKRREALKRKIEELRDKEKELLDKLTLERLAKSQSRRILPIGEDRHFRRYFWLKGKSADDGIWIQDLGMSAYEKFVRACIKAGKPLEVDVGETNQNCIQVCDEHSENEFLTPVSKDPLPEASEVDDWPKFEPESHTEVWYKLPDKDSFKNLINSLNKVGVREGKLKAFLVKYKDVILDSIDSASRCQHKISDQPDICDDDDICSESLSPLRKSIVELASDLRCAYLTDIGSLDVFEAEVACCTKLDEIKEELCRLADTITPSAIVRRVDLNVALKTGQHSVMILDRWKQRLFECENASAVHLLRCYLDSRIDWKKSVVTRACISCGSRRSPEAKISCSNCGVVIHYYCTRPKLPEKPASWMCAACNREEVKNKKDDSSAKHRSLRKTTTVPEDDYFKSSDAESSGDLSSSSENESEDHLSSKYLRERLMKDYFENHVNDKRKHAKRAKSSSVVEECTALLNRVKTSSRLYRTLQSIPFGRTTRKAAPSSIDDLEEAIPTYTSLRSFAADLNTFMKRARSYLEDHNVRKLSELEALLLDLQLESLIKR